jgi:hypothetical protein
MAAPVLPAAAAASAWRRMSRRQQLAAVLAGSAAAAWAVDLAVLRPLRHRLDHLHQAVKQTEQRLLEAVAAGRDAEAVTKAFAGYEPYVRASSSPETALAGMLSDVEAAIRDSGVVLLNLKPAQAKAAAKGAAAPAGAPQGQVVSVIMDGEAGPEQLVRLLDAFQRSPRLLRVSELTVRVSEQKTLRTSMVISTLVVGWRES